MTEVRRAMAHDDLVGHAETLERVVFECGGIDCAGRTDRVEAKIDVGASEVLDRGEANVEVARGKEALQQILRHRRAGLVVPRLSLIHI